MKEAGIFGPGGKQDNPGVTGSSVLKVGPLPNQSRGKSGRRIAAPTKVSYLAWERACPAMAINHLLQMDSQGLRRLVHGTAHTPKKV
ncbi:hypothetical protein PRtIB026_A06980 [Pseudomonas sp. RtIB026]|nr:hypothetical protein PRtIB026_A06980 [Pseudomonas sp. RtIB026]